MFPRCAGAGGWWRQGWPRGRAAALAFVAGLTATAASCNRSLQPADAGAAAAAQTAEPSDPLAAPIAALASSDAHERLGATQALAAYVEQQRRFADYRRRDDQQQPTAADAAAARSRAHLVAALPRLAALTGDAAPAIRAEAVVVLGGLGADAAPAVERIRTFMQDPANPPGYRQYGPVALGRVLGAAAIVELEQVLATAPPGDLMTTAAFFALGETGAAATATLARLAASPDVATRRSAVDTLARSGIAAAPAVPVLTRTAAGDPDYGVRAAAIRALLKVEPALTTSAPILAAAAADPRHPRHVCDAIGTALNRRPGQAATFDERLCANTSGRQPDVDGLEAATAQKQRALASVLRGRTFNGILADIPIGGDYATAAERILVTCAPKETTDVQALLTGGGTLPPAPSPLELIAVRMAADGRVLDHRSGTLDPDVRLSSCRDGQADAVLDPTRWPVLSFTHRAAYAHDGRPVVVHWAGHVILEQMTWLNRVPIVFGRPGDYVDEVHRSPGSGQTMIFVGASSGVVQRVDTPPAPLNARFATSVAGYLMGRPLVVPTTTVLRGPLSQVTLEARPWKGAPTPLPRFISAGFQTALDPAVAAKVSSLAFWRAQLGHPHMLVRLQAIRKLIDTGFEDEALDPFIQLLSVPSRYADIAAGVGQKFGPAFVPALARVVRSGDPVAMRRALGILARHPDGGASVYEALDGTTSRDAALEALQSLQTRPDEAQVALLARLLPQLCRARGHGCWQAQATLARAGVKGAAAAPSVRQVLTAESTPFGRITAARTLHALGDHDTAWRALVADARAHNDDALAALHGIDKVKSRPFLLDAVISDDTRMADAAVRMLAADPAPSDDLGGVAARLLDDTRPERRVRAVGLLTHGRTPAGDALVVRAFRDTDRRVRHLAMPLVTARGVVMLPEMRRALGDAAFEQRADMARGLGQLGRQAEAALPDLVRALDTDESGLRVAAHQAILAVGRERMPTAELLRLTGARGVLPQARRRLEVLALLRSSGGPVDASALPFLREMLPGQERHVQFQVIEALTRVGSAALPVLRQLDAATSPADLRAAARQAITTVTTRALR